MKRAILGLLLVFVGATAHGGLIFLGVYRRYPFEWWAVAVAGVLVAAQAFRTPDRAARGVAVVTILVAAAFVWVTTVGTRIKRPEPAIAAGQQLPAFKLIAADGGRNEPIEFPRASGSHRATLLVLFRGVW